MATLNGQPPPGWPQRPRRDLESLPDNEPGAFTIHVSEDSCSGWSAFHIRIRTLEVYGRRGDRWDAPRWNELPPSARRSVWSLWAATRRRRTT